jgi:hypothetical protein
MNRICKEQWEAIVDLAEGQLRPDASAHLAGCADCRESHAQLVQMMASLAVPQFTAPESLKSMAKALMSPKPARMGLLRTSLQLSGARSGAEDFQAVFELNGTEIRVMYAKEDRGWDVMGQVPAPDWIVVRGEANLEVDREGRFHFLTKTLDDSGFRVAGPQILLEVPSAADAIMGDVRLGSGHDS